MLDTARLADITTNMAAALVARRLDNPYLVGIHTGGVWVAESLHQHLDPADPPGTLDISFYRDDFSRVGLNPEVRASTLPVAVEDRNIILVDDVLHTGRTIRAGLNEIFSYGRPASVVLAVLIERPGRELPVQADVIGHSMDLADHEEARLSRSDSGLVLDVVSVR